MNLYGFMELRKKHKTFEVNEKAYHATFKRHLDSIMRDGLLPNYKERTFEFGDDVVYMFAEQTGCLECMGIAYTDRKDHGRELKEELVLLEIDISKLDVRLLWSGEAFEDWGNPNALVREWWYEGVVDPKYIKQVPITESFLDDELNAAFGLPLNTVEQAT